MLQQCKVTPELLFAAYSFKVNMEYCITDSGTDLMPLGNVIICKKLLKEVERFDVDVAHSLLGFTNWFLFLSNLLSGISSCFLSSLSASF